MNMSPANIARAVALLIAVIGAFVTIPYAALILVLLGVIVGVIGVPPDSRSTNFLMAIVLVTMGGALEPIPVIGGYLTAILAGIGTSVSAAAIAIVVVVIYERLRG